MAVEASVLQPKTNSAGPPRVKAPPDRPLLVPDLLAHKEPHLSLANVKPVMPHKTSLSKEALEHVVTAGLIARKVHVRTRGGIKSLWAAIITFMAIANILLAYVAMKNDWILDFKNIGAEIRNAFK